MEELIALFNSGEAKEKTESALPENVEILRGKLAGEQLFLYFNDAYHQMAPERELLCRAAVAKTFLQDLGEYGVSGVEFFVSDLPLTDEESGDKVGIMRADSFSNETENNGDDSNEWNLTLYFSNQSGSRLVRENRTVKAPGNISGAELIMKELLEGPMVQGHVATLNQDVILNRISVMGGVCYVNLSGELRKQDYAINADVILYSIVNSLTELPQVNHVQISIDGDSDTVFRNEISLQRYFEKNQELVE
jgi:germination protein M